MHVTSFKIIYATFDQIWTITNGCHDGMCCCWYKLCCVGMTLWGCGLNAFLADSYVLFWLFSDFQYKDFLRIVSYASISMAPKLPQNSHITNKSAKIHKKTSSILFDSAKMANIILDGIHAGYCSSWFYILSCFVCYIRAKRCSTKFGLNDFYFYLNSDIFCFIVHINNVLKVLVFFLCPSSTLSTLWSQNKEQQKWNM